MKLEKNQSLTLEELQNFLQVLRLPTDLPCDLPDPHKATYIVRGLGWGTAWNNAPWMSVNVVSGKWHYMGGDTVKPAGHRDFFYVEVEQPKELTKGLDLLGIYLINRRGVRHLVTSVNESGSDIGVFNDGWSRLSDLHDRGYRWSEDKNCKWADANPIVV